MFIILFIFFFLDKISEEGSSLNAELVIYPVAPGFCLSAIRSSFLQVSYGRANCCSHSKNEIFDLTPTILFLSISFVKCKWFPPLPRYSFVSVSLVWSGTFSMRICCFNKRLVIEFSLISSMSDLIQRQFAAIIGAIFCLVVATVGWFSRFPDFHPNGFLSG